MAAKADIVSNFDNVANGTEGWTVTGDAVTPAPTRNPGGYLEATDGGSGQVIYWVAPSKFLGNRGGYFNGSLSYELNLDPATNLFSVSNGDIRLVSSGLTLVLVNTFLSYHPDPTFKPFGATFNNTSNWRVGTTAGLAATNAQIQAVLSDLTALEIRGEYSLLIDKMGLDNVRMSAVPEPATSALFGLAGLGFAVLAKRRRHR